MAESEHIIGIDLGTTNSVVAVLEDEAPRVIPNSEGSTRTPSVISFQDNGDVLVGELARRQAAVNPSRTVSSVKRFMGRGTGDLEHLRARLPFELTEVEGELYVRVGDQGYTPPQLSAFILTKLKQAAEDYLGEEVAKAIITVPAYFDDIQRKATMEAGRLAGLEVLRLINEPTAAAMAYGLGRDGHERIAVYDFGGGTFDVTLLDIENNAFEVLTSVGDTQLGGDDIDDLLVNMLIEQFTVVAGPDYAPDHMALRRMREAAEKAKCELSSARQAVIQLPFLAYQGTTPLHLELTLTRDDLEALIEPLVERTLDICDTALRDCGMRPADITRVVLVGGSTRIPAVQDAVEDFFNQQPFKGINPDEIVAMGAATQAGVLGGKLKEVLLLDVTPHSLGVEVAENKVSRIIEKNSTIPIKAARLFTTTEDNQEMVVVHVLQGEADKANENRSLGRFNLTGIQPAKAGVPRIQVVFHINADGMVEVLAEDLLTREQTSLTLSITAQDTATPTPARQRPRRDRSGRRRRQPHQPQAKITSEVIAPAKPSDTARRSVAQGIPVGPTAVPEFQPLAHTAPAPALQPVRIPTPPPDEVIVPAGPAPPPPPVEPPPAPAEPSAADEPRAAAPAADTGAAAGPKPPAALRIPEAPVDASQLSEASRAALDYLRQGASTATALTAYVRAYHELAHYAETHPADSEVVEQTARLLLQINEPDLARRLLDSAEVSRALTSEQLASLYDMFLEKYPDDDDAVASRAWVLASMGLLDVAIGDLERVCGDDRGSDIQIERLMQLYNEKLASRDDPAIRFKLVKLLVRRGRLDEAISILQQLSGIEAFRVRATQALGFCFWQKGMHYLAWQKFQQLPLSDEVRDILYRLAVDMEDTEQLLNAKSVWQHLSEADSNYRDVAQRLRKADQQLKSQNSAFSADQDQSAAVAGFRNSRFNILEETNRGSMGIVYRAKDKVLDEIVALKVLNDYMTSDPQAVERFKREARAARRLSHPNIVRIHDMFEFGAKRLISMEYIEGRDLKKILHERKTLPSNEVIHIALSVCDALAYAHTLGIVHRDIKPANVMITTTNQVKVTDFGIAKIIVSGSPEATHSGSQILGTPLYMSPEQIRGERIDIQTDIYSLGATLYEMVGGKPPFHEGNIEYHHLHTTPAPLPDSVPQPLAQIIMRCLEKEPEKRFGSIEEMQTALRAALR